MQEQLTTTRTKGHHLTAIERGKISTLHEQGKSNREIARFIGVCHQTIANELNRGNLTQVKLYNGKRKYRSGYSPMTGQACYEINRTHCHRHIKLTQAAHFIDYFVRHFKEDGWSPDATVGRARRANLYRPEEMVCTATLYSYIDNQRLEVRNIDLTDKPNQRTKHRTLAKQKRILGRGIEERPASVEDRNEFGHYELDTIVGRRNGQESVIMAFIERKSRHQILRLIDEKDADSVNYAMRGVIKEYGDLIKTVTADNGSEFSELNSVLGGVADVYYAHPYSACERGTNEAHNRMVRRNFPKGISLDAVSPKDVQIVEDKLNRLPRKQHGYRTNEEVFTQEAQHARTLA